MSSDLLLGDFIEQLFCPSPKGFIPTYRMHQTWLNKCVMSGKQSDENFWCRDGCKAEKKVRNWTFINQAFFSCSIAAWNGVNFLPCFGRLPAPHAVHRRARASSRILLWLPWQTTCNSPPAMHHGPCNETETRWVCVFTIIEIPQIVASPVKHTSNHGQHLSLQSLPFSNRNYTYLLQTRVITADQGLISLPCSESNIIQSLTAGTLDLDQCHCDHTLLLCLFQKEYLEKDARSIFSPVQALAKSMSLVIRNLSPSGRT